MELRPESDLVTNPLPAADVKQNNRKKKNKKEIKNIEIKNIEIKP